LGSGQGSFERAICLEDAAFGTGKDREETSHLKHEWEVAKDLRHPNIIRFYDFLTQYRSPFLVLELFSALNLKLVLREGPESLAYLAEKIIQQTLHGMHYLHQRGWVHCDIKPDNMLVDDDGNVKLIDFTISQRSKRSLLSFLGFKQPVRGTRSYMSPEQIRGEDAGWPQRHLQSWLCDFRVAQRPPPLHRFVAERTAGKTPAFVGSVGLGP
jgi:eukaryotic-like serine/threonine-protein kinase